MILLKGICLIICAIVTFGESKFVDTLSKCSIKDDECLKNLLINSIKAIHKTGIPELDLPPIDPVEYNNLKINVLNMFDFEILEGKMKGIKDCTVDSYKTDLEKRRTRIKYTCENIVLKAKYKLYGSSPVIKNLFGGENIHGEGNSKVKLDKIKFDFDFSFDIEKNKDGDILLNYKSTDNHYRYEILGKVTFAADKIFLGDTDATQVVLAFMNDNQKFVMETGSKAFFDKAMEMVSFYSAKFFSVVPAKYYIIEDLSQYVKN